MRNLRRFYPRDRPAHATVQEYRVLPSLQSEDLQAFEQGLPHLVCADRKRRVNFSSFFIIHCHSSVAIAAVRIPSLQEHFSGNRPLVAVVRERYPGFQ